MIDNKQRLFEVMQKIDPSFKPKLNEDVDEGWGTNLAAGALMTAATMGGAHAQQTQNSDYFASNVNRTELSQPAAEASSALNLIKSPEDVIKFVQNATTNNFTAQQVKNLFNNQAKQYYQQLIQSNSEWKKAFDSALKMLDDSSRVGSEYVIYLKSDKAKQVGQQLGVTEETPINVQSRNNITQNFEKNGLNYYKDYVFQIVTKGKDFNRLQQIIQQLEYFNW